MRLLLLFLALVVAAPAATRPNVLVILTDDQGYGDFGFTGNQQLDTPNLDRLAAQSVRFERFYVNPLCAPTRAALLTGRYAMRGGVQGVSRGEETMRAEEITLAEVLREAGWQTGLFGKWHNGENFPYAPNGQGFGEALGFNLGHWNNYFDTTLRHNAGWKKTTGWLGDVLTEAALTFIGQNRAQPWLCWLAYHSPHSPFQCPDALFAKYKARGLDDELACVHAMCEDLDTQIGRVLARLDDWRLSENTIVIFLTDNGPNTTRYTAGLRGKKGTLYEGGVRTPLLVRFPARLREARVVRQVAAHIDVLPTVCELAGLPIPSKNPLDGRSLVPLLEGQTTGWPEREIYLQNTPRRGPRTQGSVVTQRFHAVNPGKDWELYDLANDPGEQRDLAKSGEGRMILDELVAKYERWWAEVSEGVPQVRLPIPVGRVEENPVELSAAQGELTGLHFSGRHPNNAWLVGWDTAGASVTWSIQAARPGTYVLAAAYAAEQSTTIRVATKTETAEAAVPAFASRQIPSPDRVPRSEVYEMTWKILPLGRLTLSSGEQTLTLSLPEPNPGFALKHLELRRLD
jgi:arylsulfatase A